MTDDEDPHSRTPSPPAAGPTRTTTPPPPPVLTLALPIQTPNSAAANNSNSSDTWSEGATSALIDAWGERYLRLSRGSLKHQHWQEVADAVSASASAPRTDAQCKNRIDTLKKKYKSEKSKISSGQLSRSAWPFFHRLDILIGPTLLKSQPPPVFPPQFPQRSRTQTVAKKRSRSRSRSPGPDDEDDEDDVSGGWAGMARAVARFGEAYERVERGKVKQAVEMERNRMGFVKQLELQRMEFFVKTQVELARVRPRLKKRHRRKEHRRSREENGNGNGNGDHHHHHHGRINNDSES